MTECSDPTISPLQAHLGYHLRLLSNAVSRAFALKLATVDITVAEWVILREMYSFVEGTSPSALAQHTGLTRGTVSKLVDRLLVKGVMTRSASTSDRRYQAIELTKLGRDLVPRLAQLADENDAEFFSELDTKERQFLLDILLKLAGMHGLNQPPID